MHFLSGMNEFEADSRGGLHASRPVASYEIRLIASVSPLAQPSPSKLALASLPRFKCNGFELHQV